MERDGGEPLDTSSEFDGEPYGDKSRFNREVEEDFSNNIVPWLILEDNFTHRKVRNEQRILF